MEKLIESLSRLSGNIEKLIENKISINKFNIIKWSGLSGSIWGKVGDNAAFFCHTVYGTRYRK